MGRPFGGIKRTAAALAAAKIASYSWNKFQPKKRRQSKGIPTFKKLTKAAAKALVRKNVKTKKKKKNDDQIEISQHNDLSEKDLGMYTFPHGKPAKLLGRYYYRNIVQRVSGNYAGRQDVTNFEAICTRSQLIGDTSTNANDYERWPDDPFKLNPFITSMAPSTIYPGPIPETKPNDYLYLKSVNVVTKFLSMVTVPQKVRVYWVTPTFDTNITPSIQWFRILNAKNQTQSLNPTRPTVATAGAAGGGEEISSVGSHPWEHIEFRKAWKCIKKQSFVLQPGDQRNLKFKINYEKALSRVTLVEQRTQMYLAGLTVVPMAIVEGGLVGIADPGGETSLEVSYSNTKVGYLSEHFITFGALAANRISTVRRVEHQVVDVAGTEVKRMIDDVDEPDLVEVI